MSVLVVAGLAFAARPLPATSVQQIDALQQVDASQQVDALQQADTLTQQGEPHRGDLPARDRLPVPTPPVGPASDCALDEPQAQGGPSQQEQDARRRAQKWWMSDEGRVEFGITEQQSKDLEGVFQSLLPRLRANKSELDRQEKVLSQLLNEANSDETLVVQAIDRVENARGALSRTRTLMLYRMYRLLSAEQRAKVQAYHERKSQESDNRTARR